MNVAVKVLLPGLLLMPLLLPLGGCGCGFDCNDNGNNDNSPAVLTLGFSDSLPEDLKQVVIEVDSITFRRSGVPDVVVDNFTINELGLVDAPTFQIDLLKYRGIHQLPVITNLEFTPGLYSEVSIAILTGDVNKSYVQQEDDTFKAIGIASGVRGLPSMQLSSGAQPFTVEFGLAQALQYEASSGTYLLTTNGVRLENDLTAATLVGTVNSALFNTVSPCSDKATPEKGNRVYLYKGINLLPENLADVYTINSTTPIPGNAIAPFAVASMVQSTLTRSWEYSFGFIPAGSYTIAFACDTAADDAVEYNGLTIPLPTTQKYQKTLKEGEKGVCNLAEGASSSC